MTATLRVLYCSTLNAALVYGPLFGFLLINRRQA